MNKMVVNHLEKLFVTNDAATIIKELEVCMIFDLGDFGISSDLCDTIVVVTHTKVNSIPKVNNTKVNSPRELRYQGVCGHTRNTLPRSILHT